MVNTTRTEAQRRGRPPKTEAGDTRARILDAALDGFARQGYAATSIRQITRAVGMRESSLYNHFPSKQAIFDALLADTGPGVILELLESTTTRAAHPAAVIRQLVARAVDQWDQPRARQFTSVLVREGGLESAVIGVGIAHEIQRVLDALSQLLEAWANAGLVRDDFPPAHLAWELIAPIGHIRIVHFRADASPETRREGRRLAAMHADYFLTCIGVEGSTT